MKFQDIQEARSHALSQLSLYDAIIKMITSGKPADIFPNVHPGVGWFKLNSVGNMEFRFNSWEIPRKVADLINAPRDERGLPLEKVNMKKLLRDKRIIAHRAKLKNEMAAADPEKIKSRIKELDRKIAVLNARKKKYEDLLQ